MGDILELVHRTAKMLAETKKLYYVVRILQYSIVLLLGITLAQLAQTKASIQEPANPNKAQTKKKKQQPVSKVDNNAKPSDAESRKIEKLSRTKQKLTFTRRIMRWSIILEQVFLLRQLISQTSKQHPTIYLLSSSANLIFYLIFLLLDQVTLYYSVVQEEAAKSKYSKKAIKYGRIPTHLFGSIKYGLLLYEAWSWNVFLIELSVALSLIQNVLDLVMYTISYYRSSWHRAIGTLGVATSLIGIKKSF